MDSGREVAELDGNGNSSASQEINCDRCWLDRYSNLSLPVEADRLADEATEANWTFELNVPAGVGM